jgi:hypothetical protein
VQTSDVSCVPLLTCAGVSQQHHETGTRLPAGTLHSGSYPDTLAFLRSLASLHTADLAEAPTATSLDAADCEAGAELFDWQVHPTG